MRVLVWNMNKRRRAWDYVRRNAANFDVALLQETHDPLSSLEDQWRSVIFRPYSRELGSRLARFGSAVVAPLLELEPYAPGEDLPWLRKLDGCVAVARSARDPTWLASVHLQASPVRQEILDLHSWHEVPLCNPGRHVWQMDLIPFELHRLFAGQTFLWGGDLNSAESMDDVPGFSGGNRRLREIWAGAGSCDLRLRFCAEEQQTFFAPKRGAYQLDHVFGDTQTEARVVDWRVDTGPVTSTPTLSDHAPIWIDLE
jgi:Endonuclease/Exonuclease/phosphatase family